MDLPSDFKTDQGFDPAEDHIGPFYYRPVADDPLQDEYAFIAADRHCNAENIVHGGVLMSFADYSLCMTATGRYADESCVTVSFSSEFVAAAQIGAMVLCRCELIRQTRTLAFVRGQVMSDDATVMTFSAVVRRLLNKAG
jgi:acyl-coenzyme A thioesterase PaaI-like protein